MTFTEACNEINRLIHLSHGEFIEYGGEEKKYFKTIKNYTNSELNAFENQHQIKLPSLYKEFMINVGACDIYQSSGVEFVEIEKIQILSKDYGEDYYEKFPKLLIILNHYAMGDAGGFNLENDEKFAIIPHDEAIEEWLGLKEFWVSFDTWVIKLVSSKGEDRL